MIELKNLTKVYETLNYNIIALSDINYKLDAGEVIVLLGRSGSGKSTLLNIIGGFDREYAGSYFLGDENMKEKTEREIDTIRKRRIGFVFQHYVLLNNLTVIENVELALKVIGVVNNGSRRRAALHALKLVGLRDHADKFPYELSGGQKQRVAIARSFVKNPDVIICDEPTAALDSRTSYEILELLRDLCRTKLLIIATHNKSIVRDFGTRVIELKSGYTIKDELITDPSLIKVDELDLVIDKELFIDNEKVKKIIDIEKHVTEENKATVLKDLGVDLNDFRLNTQDEFDIDEELKKDLIKERMRNSKLNTRIYRFLQTSDDFFGKRQYANKSFFRNIGLHLFSSFIFTVFLLTIVFGLNFVTETFGGFNEKALYTRTMNNENVLFFASDEFLMDEIDQDLYHDLELPFISDFTQTEVLSSKFLDELLLDPYFRYQYEQEKIEYIYDELALRNLEDTLSLYYNNSSIILKQENPQIIFDDFKYVYQNIVTYPEPYTYVTNFMGNSLDENLVYQFNFVYSENNEDILSDHILEGCRLPETNAEVVIPVSYLFKYEILNPDDFKDEFGNILEIIPSNMISEAFLSLPLSERTLDITRSVITFTDSGDSFIESSELLTSTFEVVGLINFEGDINPFLEMRDDIFVANSIGSNFSFVFSKEAEELINFEIIDNTTVGELSRSVQYAEINKKDYLEYEVDLIVKEFEESYILNIKSNLVIQFDDWISTLNDASNLISIYVQSDLNGDNPSSLFLGNNIDNIMFPGLTYQDLLDYYIAQHMSVISDVTEFNYLCTSCNANSRPFPTMLLNAQSAYDRAKMSTEYIDLLEDYGDPTRLTYQESTNRIIYNYYGHLFNNQFYESYNDEYYSLELVNVFEREYASILSLIYLVVPRVLLESLPFVDNFIVMFGNLETSPGFIHFMETSNLDLLISSISTNAVRSIVMVVLYIVVYIILLLSVVFLSVVLINLYGNIYESATRKRVVELASLRILGTSYDDIYEMIKLENRRVALFSYFSFIIILLGLSNLNIFTQAPIKHFYMPLLGLFFDFNLYDVFVLNYIALFFVTIIFYFFIYRFIIKRVSTKKLSNIDTIKAIRDGDNL